MIQIKEMIEEALISIRKKALFNQNNGNFFTTLCQELEQLEQLTKEQLLPDDDLFFEITNFRKLVC